MSSIEEFIKDPSEELLNSFVKQQLWELVDHFKISEVGQENTEKGTTFCCEKLVMWK